jgi:phosphoribulokinase
MLKLLRFLFGGEPLFGNSSNKGIFRNLEMNKAEIIPNVKAEHTERNYRDIVMGKHEDEIRNYSMVDPRIGDRGNLENTYTKKVNETVGRSKMSNHNNKAQYQKQINHLD